MTVDDDGKQPLDTSSNGVDPDSSSLPTSLRPHLYTRPPAGRASRDSGTRTTLFSTIDGDDEPENRDGGQLKLESDIDIGSDSKPSRRSMTAFIASALDQPPTSSSSTLPFPPQQQQTRSHYSNDDSFATTSNSGSSSANIGIETRPPIRSDPAYYAQTSGSGFNYAQSSSLPRYPVAPSWRRPSLSRVGIGIDMTTGVGHHPSASYPPSSLSLSGMSNSPISPGSPYSQTYSDASTSLSPGSHKGHHFPNVAPGREWPHSSMSSLITENQPNVLDLPFETHQHDLAYDRARKRSFEEEERPPSSSGATTPGIGETTAESEENSKKKQKADIACDFCRGRKLRCDTKRPQCSNCASREKQVCHYKEFQRRRGPGKANKGTKLAATKPRKSGSTAPGQHGLSDGYPAESGPKREIQSHYPPTDERGTVGYTSSHQTPNSRGEPYLRNQSEAFLPDRISPEVRQAPFLGDTQLSSLYPEGQSRYHHGFPPLPYPTGPPPNRWPSPSSPSDASAKHDPQIPIWEPPLPIHPYTIPVSMKNEGPEDRHHPQNRFDYRYDPYGQRGPNYVVFDEQYDSDDPRHNSETQMCRHLFHDSQDQFSSSPLPQFSRYGVYHPQRFEISRPSSVGSLPMPNRIESRRSGSSPSEGRPVSLNK